MGPAPHAARAELPARAVALAGRPRPGHHSSSHDFRGVAGAACPPGEQVHMAIKPAKNCVDIGLIVKDIRKSLEFYNGVLGLEKLEEMPLWFGTMHRLHFGDSYVKLIDPKKVPGPGALDRK